jgi:hypothetical protein
MSKSYTTQNDLLLENLLKYYRTDNRMERVLPIINGESAMSIRIIDWFVTNYAKKYYSVYTIRGNEVDVDETADTEGGDVAVAVAASESASASSTNSEPIRRFKVYVDYKLKLKAYSKRRFDPFCRWQRISIPYKNSTYVQTTLGQLNFFRWALDNKILDYIAKHYAEIEHDMNSRNSIAKKKTGSSQSSIGSTGSTGSTESSSEASVSGEDESSIDAEHSTSTTNSGAGTSAKSTHSTSSTSSDSLTGTSSSTSNGTRKRREELSVSAVRSMKRELVPVVVSFG